MPETDVCPPAQPFTLADHVQYADESIVSKTLADSDVGTLTLFAFDAGQKLSEHIVPFDAFVQIVHGEAELRIGDQTVNADAGQMVLMPANVPHAVTANRRFKMLLIMIRA